MSMGPGRNLSSCQPPAVFLSMFLSLVTRVVSMSISKVKPHAGTSFYKRESRVVRSMFLVSSRTLLSRLTVTRRSNTRHFQLSRRHRHRLVDHKHWRRSLDRRQQRAWVGRV